MGVPICIGACFSYRYQYFIFITIVIIIPNILLIIYRYYLKYLPILTFPYFYHLKQYFMILPKQDTCTCIQVIIGYRSFLLCLGKNKLGTQSTYVKFNLIAMHCNSKNGWLIQSVKFYNITLVYLSYGPLSGFKTGQLCSYLFFPFYQK